MADVEDERKNRKLAANGQQAALDLAAVRQGAGEHDERQEERAQVTLLEHEGEPTPLVGVDTGEHRPKVHDESDRSDNVEDHRVLTQRPCERERDDCRYGKRQQYADNLCIHDETLPLSDCGPSYPWNVPYLRCALFAIVKTVSDLV